MAETKVSKKNNIQEKDTKVKSSTKKTKKVETEKVADVKVDSGDNVKVDVEIDCRSYNHSDVVGGYTRRKRSI